MEIGKYIKQALKESGLTQRQLADMLGVKQPLISGYINNTYTPTINQLERIAKALNTDIHTLLGYNQDKDNAFMCPYCGKPIKIHISIKPTKE